MSSLPPPSQSGVPSSNSNVTYILLAVVLLIGIGGIIVWKVALKPDTQPAPTVVVSAPAASSVATNSALIDEVPLPPPVIDASPVATQAYTGGGTYDPCAISACNGNVTTGSDTDRALSLLAMKSRRKCYEPALANDPSLKGHVNVRLKIASNGQICSASVESNDMASSSVGECAARMLMSSGNVPSPHGGCVNLKLPLNYVPLGQH